MITIPFQPETFSQEAKEIVSGVNLSYLYDNIKSRLMQTAVVLQKALGKETYEKIVTAGIDAEETEKLALDYLKRAMLNFSFYHHLIFIAVRISNDGVTTKKAEDETTAFKYQTDELKISLVESAWFWMDQLYELLNSNPETFASWQASDQKKELTALLIKPEDFTYIFGIESYYFFVTCMPLIRKCIEEDITPRLKLEELSIAEEDIQTLKDIKKEISQFIKKAIVYRTLSLACKLYSFYELPAPLRKVADNEVHKGITSEEYVKNSVSVMLSNNADTMIQKLEGKMQILKNKVKGTTAVQYPENPLNETDKFYFSS
jgi:hypothetical protein